MNPKPDIDAGKLILFFLEQDSVHINLYEEEMELVVNGLTINIKDTKHGQMCTITLYSHRKGNKPSKRADLHRPLAEMLPAIEACQQKAQSQIFEKSGNPYITEHGWALRSQFLAALDKMEVSFSKQVCTGVIDGIEYEAYLESRPYNPPVGLMKVIYEQFPGSARNRREMAFIFTQSEIQRHHNLTKLVTATYAQYQSNSLHELCHPLVNYFMLQENIPSSPSGKKTKI